MTLTGISRSHYKKRNINRILAGHPGDKVLEMPKQLEFMGHSTVLEKGNHVGHRQG